MVLDVRTVSAGALFQPNVRTASAKSDGQDTVHNGGRVLFFFHCITKNRLGADRCTRMYVREEDILKAICLQLKDYVNKLERKSLYQIYQPMKGIKKKAIEPVLVSETVEAPDYLFC